MSDSPNQDEDVNQDQPSPPEPESEEPATWTPQRGPVARTIVWIILLGVALCLAALLVLVIYSNLPR